MNATTSAAVTIYIKPNFLMPDNAAYTNRFQIPSETSDNLYTVAQSKSGRWWSCGCRGWIRHRKCKHLISMGLPCFQKPFEAKVMAQVVHQDEHGKARCGAKAPAGKVGQKVTCPDCLKMSK